MTLTNAEKAMLTYKGIEERKRKKEQVEKRKEHEYSDYNFTKMGRLSKRVNKK